MSAVPLLLRILHKPSEAHALPPADWGLLLRQARSANLLGRTLARIADTLPEAQWPIQARRALRAEENLARHRIASLQWETRQIAADLASAGIRPVLLKGAAYIADGLTSARYRHFGDIDIMVPRSQLELAEKQLSVRGWVSTNRDPYDQAYYRRWMHELPPMQHVHRGTNLDLHHAILPPTARYKPPAQTLFDKVRKASACPEADVLCPEDTFLHAASHLFCEGEADMALRNLMDLADLLDTHLPSGAMSAASLAGRADELDLKIAYTLASRHLQRVLQHPAAPELLSAARQRWSRVPKVRRLDPIYDRAFRSFHPSCTPAGTGLAMTGLYLRGHLLRMPLFMLLRHLGMKALRPLMPTKARSRAT
jgi:hypothetical protein